jgi:hypothetical protein
VKQFTQAREECFRQLAALSSRVRSASAGVVRR